MHQLHDPAVRASIEARLEALRPDSPPRWGTMTVDQMLWHLNRFLEAALGQGSMPAAKFPLPRALLRFVVLHLPLPKSAPTNPGAVAKERYNFEEEKARSKALIDRFVNRPLDGPWSIDPTYGRVDGNFATRIVAKHLDHHLRQFGA
ncbi:MAG TPA: hypothetical protein VKA53_05620 [Thermoanaerobaculia bacterium]|nr:hypothetical protein [Thermoanaerobaculia bacterium]